MKSSFTLLLVVAASLCCLVPHASAWNPPKNSDRNTCGHKNPDVVNAIETFCFKNDKLMVPSPKAADGAWSKKGGISVWIRGKNCKPPQWVPSKYCFQNFFNMCVNMNKNFKSTAYYGNNGGCQAWRIKKF